MARCIDNLENQQDEVLELTGELDLGEGGLQLWKAGRVHIHDAQINFSKGGVIRVMTSEKTELIIEDCHFNGEGLTEDAAIIAGVGKVRILNCTFEHFTRPVIRAMELGQYMDLGDVSVGYIVNSESNPLLLLGGRCGGVSDLKSSPGS